MDDGTVTQRDQVVHRQSRPRLVAHSDDIKSIHGAPPRDVDHRDLSGHGRKLRRLGCRPQENHCFAAVGEQFLYGASLVTPRAQGAKHDAITMTIGGRVDRLDEIDVKRLAHGEQHADMSAPATSQHLSRGVKAVPQLRGRVQHTLTGFDTGTGRVPEYQRHQRL
jgi:hypothetical protein